MSLQRGATDPEEHNLTQTQSIQANSQISERPGAFRESSIDAFALSRLSARCVIGHSNFGVVRLAQDKETGKALAVKEIDKNRLRAAQNVRRVFTEKTILASLRHPLVVDFHGTCQDEKKLYLVMECVQGGELLSFLSKRGALTTTEARFYAAEVTSVLTYLHSQGIIYRDLKPENVLISTSGHIKLTDFDSACRLKFGEKTFTLCGISEYLAPEMILRSGHDFSLDWWTLGIFLHELLFGTTPFDSEDPYNIYVNIISKAYCPPAEIDNHTRNLLQGLLDKDPSHRYAGEKVRSHAFFAGVDWGHLERLQPAFVPVVKTEMDHGNIESLEEMQENEGTVENQADFQGY